MLSVGTADRSLCICKINPGCFLFTHSARSLRWDISFWVMCLYLVCCTLRYLWTSLIIPSTSISDDSLCDVYRWVHLKVVLQFLWKLELHDNIIIHLKCIGVSTYCTPFHIASYFHFNVRTKAFMNKKKKARSTNSQTIILYNYLVFWESLTESGWLSTKNAALNATLQPIYTLKVGLMWTDWMRYLWPIYYFWW